MRESGVRGHCFRNFRKFPEIAGNCRQFAGNCWQLLAAGGGGGASNFRKFPEILPEISGNFRKLPEITPHCISGQNWRKFPELLEIAGNFRKLPEISGNCRKFPQLPEIAEISGNCRPLPPSRTPFRPALAPFSDPPPFRAPFFPPPLTGTSVDFLKEGFHNYRVACQSSETD